MEAKLQENRQIENDTLLYYMAGRAATAPNLYNNPAMETVPEPGNTGSGYGTGPFNLNGRGSKVQFGSDTKSAQKLNNQMIQRGWTEGTVRSTVDAPYTTRASINMATGNPATVYYNQQGGYVIVDDVTNAVVQVSDNINPSTWIPDPNIVNPYIPK